jgi:ankyrin repeat protein
MASKYNKKLSLLDDDETPSIADLKAVFSRDPSDEETASSYERTQSSSRGPSSYEERQSSFLARPPKPLLPRHSGPTFGSHDASSQDEDSAFYGRVHPVFGSNPNTGHNAESRADFPVLEIERIRKKTHQMRQRRTVDQTGIFGDEHKSVDLNHLNYSNSNSPQDVFDDDIGGAASSTAPSSSRRGSKSQRSWSADLASHQERKFAPTNTAAAAGSHQSVDDSLKDFLDGSAASQGAPVSQAARELQQEVLGNFQKRGRQRSQTATSGANESAIHSTRGANAGVPTTAVNNFPAWETNITTTPKLFQPSSSADDNVSEQLLFPLHDLCGEAIDTDDVAWRNALYLLSNNPALGQHQDADGWTPLHICCMGRHAAPAWMLRALVYCAPGTVRVPDAGGRLPLHLVAATSAHAATMQMLTDEYPQGLCATDEQGFTPLVLLVRNLHVELTSERVSILLGLTATSLKRAKDQNESEREGPILHRRRDHLNLQVHELNALKMRKPGPVTVFHHTIDHELEFEKYPQDVQLALRKLSKWKRDEHGSGDLRDDERICEMNNPAAVPAPNTRQLPVHMIVRRAIMNRPLLMDDNASKVKDQSVHDEEDSDEDEEDTAAKSTHLKQRSSVPNPYDVLRLVVASFPEGLLVRDSDGFTPLLLTMLETNYLPSLATTELLLGLRTSGSFETIPTWAGDLPLHGIHGSSSYMNPAMVVHTETGQLPLHLAAEELLADYNLIKTIHDAYPGAIFVQDHFGRTPLHTAIRSYRQIPIDPRVLSVLFSDRVAQIRDDQGKLPFNLLLSSSQTLPRSIPRSWEDPGSQEAASVYRRFIEASIMASTKPKNQQQTSDFLHSMRTLPPWLRRQACSSSVLQQLLIDDLAGPWKFSMIMLDGLLLIALITVFRLQMNEYIESVRNGAILSTCYTFAVYVTATLRLVMHVALWVVLASFGEFQHSCLFNLSTWIDAIGMLLSIITSMLVYGDEDEERLLTMGTASTGFLWLSLLGYLATWWYGMSVFWGALGRIAYYLMWPCIIIGAAYVGFSQMVYTTLQVDCVQGLNHTHVCTAGDSYRAVYMLLRGSSLLGARDFEPLSNDATVLAILFLLSIVLLCLGLLLIVFMASAHTDFESIASKYFWEPKLAQHFTALEFGLSADTLIEPVCWHKFSSKLESVWNLFMMALFGSGFSRKKKQWKASSTLARGFDWPLSVVAVIIIPIWVVVGGITLGWLWPPQLRRLVFQPHKFGRKEKNTLEEAASQVSRLRGEIASLKIMFFERTCQAER